MHINKVIRLLTLPCMEGGGGRFWSMHKVIWGTHNVTTIYSSSHKSWIFCFAPLLIQILVNYQNQGHIWKLLVLTFSKHPLHVQFDQVLAEIFEVKDIWNQSFIFLIFDLLEMKITEIWTICSKNGSVHQQRYQYQQE